MTSIWKVAGRISATNAYFFYQLVNVPGYGLAVINTRVVDVDTFLGRT